MVQPMEFYVLVIFSKFNIQLPEMKVFLQYLMLDGLIFCKVGLRVMLIFPESHLVYSVQPVRMIAISC